MISPRWRKVLKDLWGNKLRTGLVVLSIAVGVFAVGMIGTVNQIITTDMNQAYRTTNPAHVTFYLDPFGDDLVQSIHSMPQVEATEGRHSITVRYKTGSGQWGNLKLTVIADYKNISVTQVFPQSGAWPPPRKEVLLERASVGFTNRNIGDALQIETPQGKQRTLRVAGTVHDMNEAPPLFTGQAYGYITSSTLEWLGYDRGYTELLVRFPAEKVTSKAAVQALADEVQAKLERSGHTVGWTYVPEPGKHPIDEIIAPMALILGVLGFLALLLSGFLVINTISAVLTQQVRQIGIMKTIGARNGQIMGLYYSMVFVFSVLALCLGVPAGAMGGQGVGGYMASLINFDISTKGIPHQVLGLEVAVGLLVPFLAALWPVWSGARISIRLALNGRGIGKGGTSQGYVDRILEQIRGLSRPVLLSLRNTFRRKGRLSLTLATLTLGGAIFVAVLTVHASLGQTLNDALNYWRYDVQVSFGRTYRTGQLIRAAQQTPGVAQAECWAGFGARRIRPDGREGDNFELLALPVPSDFISPYLVQGRWLLPGDENALVLNTDVLKTDNEVRVGDSVTLKINGKESNWRVVGIVRGIMMGSVGYANYSYVTRITGRVGVAGQVLIMGMQHDTQSQIQLAKRLEVAFKAAGYQVRSTETITDIRSRAQSQFNILVIFLLIMAVLLAVVGGLGLMGTMSINVLERTREIGVMRAIGASNWGMMQVFLVEGIFIGLLSWLLGAFLSIPLSRMLTQIVGDSMLRAPLSYRFSFIGLALWLIIVGVLAALSSLLPAWKAARLTVRDVLAYE